MMKKIILSILFLAFIKLNARAQATSLIMQDTRSSITTPSSYSYSLEGHFKYGSSIGLSEGGGNPYYALIGLRGWQSDNSGGKAHELAFSNDGQILFRSGYSPSWEGWRKILVSNENGNFGIGTTTPQEKLSVNGKIRAQEVKVETSNWPDYVFAEDYKPISLNELEKFVKINKHLPEMPSAQEIEKNGVELGEMNKKLLKRVEELTLLLIEQNKKQESHYSELNELKKANDQLTSEINQLKTKQK